MSITPGRGPTPAGFVARTSPELVADMKGDVSGLINPNLDLSDDQPVGQLLTIGGNKLAEIWEVLAVLANVTSRGNAEDAMLDNIGDLTRTKRLGVTASTVPCLANFSASGVYAQGSLVAYLASPAPASVQFANAFAITVPTFGADGENPVSATNTWPNASGATATLAYGGGTVTMTLTGGATIPASAAGQSVFIANSTTAGNNGTFPNLTRIDATHASWVNASGAADASGTVVWCVGPFQPQVFASTTSGPSFGDALIAADSAYQNANSLAPGYTGQLSQRVPVAGWTMLADIGGVTLGTLVEQDAAYRLRQVADIAAAGNNTQDATKAAILIALQDAPEPVAATVQMYENTKPTNDLVTALPAKSFMAVVFDGTDTTLQTTQNDALIAQAIWNNKPDGIQSFGYTAVQAVDASGNPQTVWFTRPTPVALTLAMKVFVSPTMTSQAQTALQAVIIQALINASQGLPFTLYGTTVTPGSGAQATLVPGADAISNAFKAIAQGQSGVIDVEGVATPTASLITSPPPNAQGNVTIGISQIATVNTVSITIYPFVP